MLDWAVGGYMMFVGITAIIAGLATARDLKLFKFSIKSEEDLKQKWEQYDADGNGALDVKELSVFIRESGINMTTNEIAATYMTLDKNFDEKITFEEFYMWWMNKEQGRDTNEYSV
jgi:Ca2+-binding EF-hand superfamily protein